MRAFDPIELRKTVLRMAFAGSTVHIACAFSLILLLGLTFLTASSSSQRRRTVMVAVLCALLIVVVVSVILAIPSIREMALSRASLAQDYDVERLTWLWKTTSAEDKKIVEMNQAGVNSRFFEPGPYSLQETYAAAANLAPNRAVHFASLPILILGA